MIILNDLLTKHNLDLAGAFSEFTNVRNEDAKVIVDLALYNYIEMRDLVNQTHFRIRKKFDDLLHWIMPSVWVPLYTTVTFSRLRYSDCLKNKEWQDKVIRRLSISELPDLK